MLLALGSAACTYDEPKAADPTAILGCYRAPDAPAFQLTKKGMQLNTSSQPASFRYEFRKAGYVIDVPLSAQQVNGRFVFSRGERHFFSVIPSDAGPTIRVSFGPPWQLVTYSRSKKVNCF